MKIDEKIANFEKQIIKAGEEIVVLDNMHTGSPSNLKGLQCSLKLIQASCNDLPGMDLHPEKIYHLGISSSCHLLERT